MYFVRLHKINRDRADDRAVLSVPAVVNRVSHSGKRFLLCHLPKEQAMNFINCLLDVADDEITDAIKDQACLMVGISPDEIDSDL